ncbi:MAG: signal peptidase I [Candidatus Aadella gelida]|nr:signal peptidase I [Candidatus Aadella gelida]
MKISKEKWDYLWTEWVKPILIAAALALFVRTFMVQPFKIPSSSMYPTLKPGDRIFVNKFIYGAKIPFTNIRLPKLETPKDGDIIVFTSPVEKNKYLVKRFIADGGEAVSIKSGSIFVDEKKLSEAPFDDLFYYNRGEYGAEDGRVEIPEGKFYVLGDNSANSMDSRYWGYVPDRNIVGKAFVIHWPPGRMHLIKEGE